MMYLKITFNTPLFFSITKLVLVDTKGSENNSLNSNKKWFHLLILSQSVK